MSEFPFLSERHLAMLRQESGLSEAIIQARGYRTVTDEADLIPLGFAPWQRRTPGLLLPLHTTDGRAGSPLYRPDNPRVVENRRQKNGDGTYVQRVVKYEQPAGEAVRVDGRLPAALSVSIG
ncbi:MAG: hypothetical protein HND44_20995 [Chloroflexi bacterium]|nr:hypothetical protein [Ardenticatenaceae bacterium]MBL1130922.1 hypothetical protein [Chloroflexota bacterium]NOG37019.1 hypothetical protein [Chloroflexota bacterium]